MIGLRGGGRGINGEEGNGTREAGTEAIHEFTEVKSVFIDYSERLQKAQITE